MDRQELQLLSETSYIKPQTIRFIRYGDLNPVKQAGYKKSLRDGYGPPRKRGIYAFVWPYIDLGQIHMSVFDPSRHHWVRRKDGSRIGEGDQDSNSFSGKDTTWLRDPPRGSKKKRGLKAMDAIISGYSKPYDSKDYFLARLKKRKTFAYKGALWHHLPVSEDDILDFSGVPRDNLPGWWVKTSYQVWVKALARSVGTFNRERRTGDDTPAKDKGKYEVFIERI